MVDECNYPNLKVIEKVHSDGQHIGYRLAGGVPLPRWTFVKLCLQQPNNYAPVSWLQMVYWILMCWQKYK